MVRRPLQWIPAAQLDDWFAAEYGTRLGAAGFSPVRRRVWVRSAKEPIREGFSIVALKGYSFVPGWFVSLDLPRRPYFALLETSGIGNPRVVRWRIRQSARLGVRLARAWFSRFSDVASLLPRLDRALRRVVTGVSASDSDGQHRMALAFTLARLGDRDRARRELAAWCGSWEGLSATAEARVRELLERAGAEGTDPWR